MKSILLIFSVLFLVSIATFSQGFISTIAGGNNGDGKLATDFGLYSVPDIATDSADNVYFIDRFNRRIYKISSSTGILNVIAGRGYYGTTGDGANALSATFATLASIALDKSGNLYIIENSPNRIRRIDAVTNIITTIAGLGTGPLDSILAINPSLPSIAAIAIDTANNIYFVANNKIIKVSSSTGIVTTVAGNGTIGSGGNGGLAVNAELGNPSAIAVDIQGSIYIVDKNNNVIRKIDASTGIINVFAGNGAVGFSGDGGLALNAQLSNTKDIAADTFGNIYITDNNRIRRISGDTITTIAGNATYGYTEDGLPATSTSINNPGALAISTSGNIYYNDVSNSLLRKVRASDNVVKTIAGNRTQGTSGIVGLALNAQLNHPKSVAIDSTGNIYFPDLLNAKVYKIANSTGIITTVAGTGEPGLDDGNNGLATAAKITEPESITVDKAGNFYFIDYGRAVRKVNVSTGIITRVAGNGTSYGYSGDGGPATLATINSAAGIALDKWGNIYIADEENHCIRKVTAATGVISTVAGSGVKGYTGDGGIATAARLRYPVSVAVDNKGNIYISDNGNYAVRKVDSLTGIITTIAGTGRSGYNGDNIPGTFAMLYLPWGLSTDTTGNVYIADQGNSRIREVTVATGIITTVAGTGDFLYNGDNIDATYAGLNNPADVKIDLKGNLYIGDYINNRIRKVIFPLPASWMGKISSDWNNAANWNNNQIPGPTTTVTITAGTPYNPVISSGLDSAYNIQIASGASLTLNGGTFTIVNSISGTGVINGSNTANLVISGSIGGNAGTLNFNPAFNKLNNLTVNRTGLASAVTIGTPLTVQGNVNIAAGTLYVSGIQIP